MTMLLAVSYTALAQDVSFGAIGGINFSKIDNLGGSGFEDHRVGYHVGGFAEIPFARNWSYEASLLYSTEGENWDDASGDEIDIKLSYINVPFQFKYYAYKSFSIHLGPQIGFLLNSEYTINDGESIDVPDTVNTSFAGTVGVGYEFVELGIYLKGTFTYGFIDVIDNRFRGNNQNQLPGTVHASVGYKF